MNLQGQAEQYWNKTYKELLRLALSPDQLRSEAQVAPTTKLGTRGIAGEASLHRFGKKRKSVKLRMIGNLGRLGSLFP
jgi:hypothetical protein